MVKKFLVVFTVKGSVFKEIVEGNLRVNAINKVREKGAGRIIRIEEVKV